MNIFTIVCILVIAVFWLIKYFEIRHKNKKNKPDWIIMELDRIEREQCDEHVMDILKNEDFKEYNFRKGNKKRRVDRMALLNIMRNDYHWPWTLCPKCRGTGCKEGSRMNNGWRDDPNGGLGDYIQINLCGENSIHTCKKCRGNGEVPKVGFTWKSAEKQTELIMSTYGNGTKAGDKDKEEI